MGKGVPNIIIEFKQKASTAMKRGERGIVAVMVLEENNLGIKKLTGVTEIPVTLTEANQKYVKQAFLGGKEPVKEVQLIVTDTVANGIAKMETVKFDYLAAPPTVTAQEATSIAEAIKTMRDAKNIRVKAVLPNTAADHEGIINFTTSGIVVGDETYTAAQYCARIAGILAGMPLKLSSAFYVLKEVDDVPKMTKAELDKKVDDGEFVLFHDGEKVKVARGVNSYVTTDANKGEDYKSIKVVDTLDMIYNDVKSTCEDVYIGNFPNNYDNKCILIVAVQTYLEALRDEELLDDTVSTGIDLEAQTMYLKEQGVNTAEMSEQEIKEANTRTDVFLTAEFKVLHAIEDIRMRFYM